MFKGLYLGGSGWASTTNPDITGDLTVVVELWKEAWTNGISEILASVYETVGDQRSWLSGFNESNQFEFGWSTDGVNVTFFEDDVPSDFLTGDFTAFKVEFDSDPGTITLSVAAVKAGPWTELGTHNIGGITTLHSSSAPLAVGVRNSENFDNVVDDPLQNSVVKSLEVYSGISTNLVVDARFENEVRGTTSFTDDTANVWTLSDNAVIIDGQTPEIGLWVPSSTEIVAEWAVADTPGEISEVNMDLIDAFVGDQDLESQTALIRNNMGEGPFGVGGGGSRLVKWREINGMVFVWWDISFGTNQSIPALGFIEIDLPVAADMSFHSGSGAQGVGDLIGEGQLYDTSSIANRQLCSVQLLDGSKIRINLEGNSTQRSLTGDDPFVPDDGDAWNFNAMYKVAP